MYGSVCVCVAVLNLNPLFPLFFSSPFSPQPLPIARRGRHGNYPDRFPAPSNTKCLSPKKKPPKLKQSGGDSAGDGEAVAPAEGNDDDGGGEGGGGGGCDSPPYGSHQHRPTTAHSYCQLI